MDHGTTRMRGTETSYFGSMEREVTWRGQRPRPFIPCSPEPPEETPPSPHGESHAPWGATHMGACVIWGLRRHHLQPGTSPGLRLCSLGLRQQEAPLLQQQP